MAWLRKKEKKEEKPKAKIKKKIVKLKKTTPAAKNKPRALKKIVTSASAAKKVSRSSINSSSREFVAISTSSHAHEVKHNGSRPAPQWQRMQQLPSHYGDNQIYLLVRDPHSIYAYWEIQKDRQEKALAELGGSWDHVKSILRVYDITDRNNSSSFFDITLQGLASAWYIEVQPNRSYVVEIGLLDRHGRFIALARSNEVTTPRAGMSEIIDEQWMGIDFDKIYALSGGFEVGKSSAELQKLMQERLKGAISSGSGGGVLSSGGSPARVQKQRGFWFVLDCEVIVYGATEPDAKVTLQGNPVQLRPDGTFTLRFALPDGKQVLDAHAFSADGVEERVIIPVVERKTERPVPVVKSLS